MQFSEYANSPSATACSNGKPDPFNFPMPNRADTMSLNTITTIRDGMKTSTVKFDSMRGTS